ncbi:MAG: ABC transporter ATP-binding protein [Lachnospiraceae bacterium]|nr:ABC transporter ATP-binding protein [Lachnospiraceae bacterium]
METILEIKNVKKRFGNKLILKGINLTVKEGEIISVLGPSGCGKSTLLNIIAGILPLDEGVVVIGGKEVSGPNQYLPIEKRNINMVFQDFALWPHMTAKDNILYGLKIKKMSSADMEAALKEVVSLLHLEGLLEHFPAELSGGQQQRVAIARALITKPALILLDEPLCNLDVQLRVEMRTEMAQLFHQLKTTVFHVTHDPSEAFAMADRIIVMNNGIIDQVDTPEVCYVAPRTAMVAGLLGAGNILKKGLPVELASGDAKAGTAGRKIRLQVGKGAVAGIAPNPVHSFAKKSAELRFRPEDCTWVGDAPDEVDLASGRTSDLAGSIAVKVIMSTFEGGLYRVKVATEDQEEFCILSPQLLKNGQMGNVKVEESKLYAYEQN